MNEKTSYSKLAAIAMLRASKLAQNKAADLNLDLPIWENDKIIYIKPTDVLTTDIKSE